MYRTERINAILETLKRTRCATVEELSQELFISASSIRRDLVELEGRGLVIRKYGGVELAVTDKLNVPFSLRMKVCVAEKKQIAQKAAALVEDGDVVFLDASTTAMYLAQELCKKNGLTVITNGIHAVQYLADYRVKVICTGGTLDYDDRAAMVGSETLKIIENMHADIAFIAPQAIDAHGTLYDYYREEAAIVSQMLRCATRRIALCDQKKIAKSSTFKQCSVGDLDVLISDVSQRERFGEMFPDVIYL